MQEAIRNYEDTSRSGFCFHLDDISDLLRTFVIPHIHDLDDQRYYYNLDMATTEAEDLSRAVSMVTQLPKAVKIRFLLATSAPIRSLPFLESSLPSICTRKSRRSKTMLWSSYTRTLLPYSRCFSILLQTHWELDDTDSADTLLFACQSSTFDLCQMLFEFLGKTIVQPHQELFKKATGLSALILLALASLSRLNPSRLWLLPGSMI